MKHSKKQMSAWLPACLAACLPACLPACLLVRREIICCVTYIVEAGEAVLCRLYRIPSIISCQHLLLVAIPSPSIVWGLSSPSPSPSHLPFPFVCGSFLSLLVYTTTTVKLKIKSLRCFLTLINSRLQGRTYPSC